MSAENNSLPRDWVLTNLGEIVQPTRPRHSPQDFPALPFIGMEHIEAHTMKLLGTVLAATMKSSAVHFQPSDVLYGRLRPYLNKVFCPDFEGLCSAEFIVFPQSEYLHSKFVQYLLNSAGFVSFSSHLNAGDRPRVDFEQISHYRIPLPPLPEQRRIVEEIEKQFTRLEAAVASLKRVQANLKRYRAAVLKAAVEGRLVPTEAEVARAEGRSYEPADQLLARILAERRTRWEADQLGKMRAVGKLAKDDNWRAKYKEPAVPDPTKLSAISEGWTWASLDQLTNKVGDVDHKMPRGVSDGGLPYVSTKDFVANGEIDFDEAKQISLQDYESLSRKIKPESGDILLSRYGTVGEVRKVPPDVRFQASYSLAIIKPVPALDLTEYLLVALQSGSVQEQMRQYVRASSQPDLGLEYIRLLPIRLPPLAEQKRVVSELDRRFSNLKKLNEVSEVNLMRAERLRQAILKRAFEGKLVPQDPNDEPASVLLERIRTERAVAQPLLAVRTKKPKKRTGGNACATENKL